MTKEEIKTYLKLQKELETSAKRVAKYFIKLNSSYKFINSWNIDDDLVEGEGSETWSYGGYEDHYVSFDVKWLSATDEELQSYVDSALKERKKKIQREIQDKLNSDKEKRKELYMKLKKEFEE